MNVRLKARIRDKFTCQSCGLVRTPEQAKVEGTRNLHVHHLNGLCGKIKYDKTKSSIDGLITLCHKCHFHRHDWAGKERRVSIRRGVKTVFYPHRDRDIAQRYQKNNDSMRAVGEIFGGISRQRVFQIKKEFERKEELLTLRSLMEVVDGERAVDIVERVAELSRK